MAETLPIGEYLFMGSATVSGIFVDTRGGQVGLGFTGSASTTVAKTLWEIAGLQSHPTGAHRAIINITSDLWFCTKGGVQVVKADFVTNYATKYPKFAGPATGLEVSSALGTIVPQPLPAGTAYVGQTGPALREVAITFTLDTSIYAANDVLADSQILASVVSASDANGYLVGVQILDEDDQAAAAMTMYLLSANVTLGTENNAISISDANARNIIGVIDFAVGDWKDLINSKLAFKGAGNAPLPIAITPVAGSDDIYVALVTGGTPTQTASGITGRFWFQDGV